MSLSSQLNQRVQIERLVSTPDDVGGTDLAWETLAAVFASVTPVYGAVRERAVGEQLQANAAYRVVMRARGDITAAMRIIWKARTLLIHSLHETDETIHVLCYEENV